MMGDTWMICVSKSNGIRHLMYKWWQIFISVNQKTAITQILFRFVVVIVCITVHIGSIIGGRIYYYHVTLTRLWTVLHHWWTSLYQITLRQNEDHTTSSRLANDQNRYLLRHNCVEQKIIFTLILLFINTLFF